MSATVPAWSGDWGWTDSPPIAGQVLLAGSAAWRLETGTVWDWTPWLSDCASGPVKMRGELPLPAAQRKIEFRSVGRGRLVGFCSSTHNNTMPSALAHCWRLGESRTAKQGRSSEISRRCGAACRAHQTVNAVSIGNQSLSNLASYFVELGRIELGRGPSPRGAAAMND